MIKVTFLGSMDIRVGIFRAHTPQIFASIIYSTLPGGGANFPTIQTLG